MNANQELSAVAIARMLRRPDPTPEQIEVIEAPLEPMLVVAGAGSGKTETMAARVVWLIANNHVAAEEVLGLTFTRKAASELSERITTRLAQLARARGQAREMVLDRPTVATYNSYAASLVKDHALRLGVEPDARLLTEASQWQLAASLVEAWAGDLATDAAFSTVVRAVVELSSALNEHLLTPAQAGEEIDRMLSALDAMAFGSGRKDHYAGVKRLGRSLAERRRILDLVAEYQQRKRAADMLDFADQVALAARLAMTVPAVRAAERSRFRVVLLDEYQDTSYAQIELLAGLYGGGHAVTAVGDPNQSIYGWRGASAAGLARFPERFTCSPQGARSQQGALQVPAQVRYLRTSWRNDQAILVAANTVAKPLRLRSQRVGVPELAVRPEAGPGQVEAVFPATVEEEMAAVADFIAEHWRPASARRTQGETGGSPVGTRTTAAVLCRRRAQFVAVEVALRARGLPVEVVGLGGLLSTPEVVDVVALLETAHDPSRGDSLMRLLTGPRVNLGAADVHALGSWAADLVRGEAPVDPDDAPGAAEDADAAEHADASRTGSNRRDEQPGGEQPVQQSDVVDHRSLIDALDELPSPGVAASDGRRLTRVGLQRLRALARIVRDLRRHTYLSLPELVVHAERALGLDIEVQALAGLDGGLDPGRPVTRSRGRANLDAFRDVAADFSQSADTPTLGAFLAWLATAGAQENGLDMPVQEPDHDAVQIITVHAAKGLEWDVVAVPGMVDGEFPSTATQRPDGPQDSGWTTGLDSLPYPLRGDAEDLPGLNIVGAVDGKDLEARRIAFTLAAGDHEVAEERRLAYVAFTRARRHLLISGSWWRDAAKPRPPSPFLTELVEAGVCRSVVSEPPQEESNPRRDRVTEGVWPDTGPRSPARSVLAEAARTVDEALAASPSLPDPGELVEEDGTDLAVLAGILLEERDAHATAVREIALPDHVSASGLVRLARGRDEFALDLRRPVPAQPSVGSTRGTRFHLWVERYFTAASLLDEFDVGPEDEVPDGVELADLQDGFLASPWARKTPIAVEVDVETPIGGVMVRSRIDAVFPDDSVRGDGPGRVVVVDWKTGREPGDPESRRAREVQLAVYRLAWSRWSGVPLKDVDAAFYYVSSGTTVRPRKLLEEQDIEQLLRGPAETGSARRAETDSARPT